MIPCPHLSGVMLGMLGFSSGGVGAPWRTDTQGALVMFRRSDCEDPV